ncbi:MAG: histidinol-phosphate transaminase [Candidatus Krumholzibacteriota bacterium]|nr:histidinol-phosphate transaminase [Candidatus Krumholzibacteriota bacterium]
MDFRDLLLPHLRNVRPYIPGKPVEELRRERNIEGEILKLASNENPNEPIEAIRLAIVEEIAQLNRYPNSGSYYLVHDIAAHLGVEPERIFVGNGSNEILDLMARAFVGPGDEIVYPYPSFLVYPIVAQLSAAKAVEVPLENHTIDLQAVREAMTQNTRMVFICNPNNPTSTYIGRNDVERFMNTVREETIIVFDEAYFEYVTADDYPDTIAMITDHPNIVVTRTFSKIYSLSGLRIGYAVADPGFVECMHRIRQPFNVNRIAQAAARAAIANADKVREIVEENRRELEFLTAEMEKLGFEVPPSQTNFILAFPPAGTSGLADALLDRGIIVRPMKPYGLGEETIRVSVGTPYENRRFVDVLREVL